MKINIDIDCTPAEARAFFGLPDIAPMQEEMIREMQKQMMDNINNMDGEALMKFWFPKGYDPQMVAESYKGIENMQKAFMDTLMRSFGAAMPPGAGGGDTGSKT